jgi:glycosyltransferase involved in cell wall biosynthesis
MLASALARIGVDGLAISPAGKGLARVEKHAVEALAARAEHDLVVFVREPVALEGVEVVRVSERLTLDWELRGMPRAARRHRLDAMLTLTDRLPFAGGPPTVVWLFESPVHRIEQNRKTHAPLWNRSSDVITAALWRRSLRRAAHVATGSRATEQEILAEVPELAGRTSVVYPALAPGFGPGAASGRGSYVLHVGSADPRENTEAAIEACRLAGVRLLVAGGAHFDAAGPHVEFRGRVSDEELVDLYRGAAAFIDPTLYEGFGYGVLEAMACGAPVVASSTTSIPEVVGDAALLVDPRDPAALAASLRRILDEPGLADDLRGRGLERARWFTWERSGAGLSAAIDEGLQVPSAPSARTSSA